MTKCIFNLIQFFPKYHCGSCQGCSSKNCSPTMIEQWRDCIDDTQIGGAILTDLFKAFDIVNHDLLIAKLAANGFSHESLNLIRSYLTDRKQRIRINHTYSSY